MKRRGDPRVNIVNDGHVETPIEVEFHGPAENPRVTNLTTGEYVQVNRTLTSDDVLFINTAFRNKIVEIERNGIRRMRLIISTWVQPSSPCSWGTTCCSTVPRTT